MLFFLFNFFLASAQTFSPNHPTNTSCVNWNQYYTNCTQLGGNPFQGTISFDNIGMAWVAIFLVCVIFVVYIENGNVRTDKSWPVYVSTHNIICETKGEIDFFFLNLKGNLVRGLDRYNVLCSGNGIRILLTNLIECSHSGCT